MYEAVLGRKEGKIEVEKQSQLVSGSESEKKREFPKSSFVMNKISSFTIHYSSVVESSMPKEILSSCRQSFVARKTSFLASRGESYKQHFFPSS